VAYRTWRWEGVAAMDAGRRDRERADCLVRTVESLAMVYSARSDEKGMSVPRLADCCMIRCANMMSPTAHSELSTR